MTAESRHTEDQPKTLGGFLNTLSEYAGLVADEFNFRNGKRKELKGIIINKRNIAYENIVCEFLTDRLSERDANPNNLSKWFSELCVPQFDEEAPELPFNYLDKRDPRSEFKKNEYNLRILRYRVWEKLSDNIPTAYRAHIIDIRRRFFDALLDSQ